MNMTSALFITQLLNGFQLGVLLFLFSAGLTLIFGIMNFVNLAHGSLYMMGAYFAAAAFNWSHSFTIAAVCCVAGTFLLGFVLERLVFAGLYMRDHLDQVLTTFGLILLFNEVVRFIWGPSPLYINVPDALAGTVELFGLPYPSYRFLIIVVGLAVSLGLYLLIHQTRAGMLIRASTRLMNK
jgi:branched-chain amino acid transport system permease protein